LRQYLTRCTHCHIFFISHPCNAGRTDLGCPFGCSQSHRQRQSTKRSSAYYQTDEGKDKKKRLNANTQKETKSETEEQKGTSTQNKTTNTEQHAIDDKPSEQNTSEESQAINPDNKMLHYLQCLFNLIEQQFLTYQQIISLLNKKIRQHSLRKRKEMDYVIDYCCNKPP